MTKRLVEELDAPCVTSHDWLLFGHNITFTPCLDAIRKFRAAARASLGFLENSF
jgi:hypothetical protein